MADDKIDVMNPNTPGKVGRVDAVKYAAMKAAVLKVTPSAPPGLTAKDMKEAAKAHLPDDLFPGGQTSGWWQKCVQLDMEARGQMQRSDTSPLRFWLTGKEGA